MWKLIGNIEHQRGVPTLLTPALLLGNPTNSKFAQTLMLKGNTGAVSTVSQLGCGSSGRKDAIASARMKLPAWISPLVQRAAPGKFSGHEPALPSAVKDGDRRVAEGALCTWVH